MLYDTIAAVSTPRGKGGVALLRISGPEAISVCEKVFEPKNGKSLGDCTARTAIYGRICVGETGHERVAVDDGIATVFRAPASFTGEDTVEICCHGGILLTETILTALFTAGARPAEAGEFTRRAFLNGKMGLSAAESLADLLEANSREQILLAHTGMNGRTGERCAEFYTRMRRILASVYAGIDYPDEDLAEMSREELCAELRSCAEGLRDLAKTYRTGHAVAEGIRTVICGRPNVGKSSLYNRILGREAAIVTDVEGTTRDVLADTAVLGKVTLRLCDTAGLRDTGDRVERIGIERAKKELEQAELVFAVFDASAEPDEEDEELCRFLDSEKMKNVAVIAVLNKCDLTGGALPAVYRERFPYCVAFSALRGEGYDALKRIVEELFIDGKLDLRQDAVLANARQHAAVEKALSSVEGALGILEKDLPLDICCSGVENAMAHLGELDGRAVSEDLVSEIFSHFCVGK